MAARETLRAVDIGQAEAESRFGSFNIVVLSLNMAHSPTFPTYFGGCLFFFGGGGGGGQVGSAMVALSLANALANPHYNG